MRCRDEEISMNFVQISGLTYAKVVERIHERNETANENKWDSPYCVRAEYNGSNLYGTLDVYSKKKHMNEFLEIITLINECEEL